MSSVSNSNSPSNLLIDRNSLEGDEEILIEIEDSDDEKTSSEKKDLGGGNLSKVDPLATVLKFDKMNGQLLTGQPMRIALLAQRLTPLFQNTLFEYIERSKSDLNSSIAAANAISILSAAGVNLSLKNFSGIRIAGANLTNAILTQTDLSKADLRNVQMHDAVLDYSSMANSNVEGLELGQKAAINITPEGFSSIEFSPEQNKILLGDMLGIVRLCDSLTGKEILSFQPYQGRVSCLSYTLVGQKILSGSQSSLEVRDLAGDKIINLQGHEGWVEAAAIFSDGCRIVTGGHDNTVRLWNAHTGEQVHCLEGHTDWVQSVAFSPDGKWVASGSLDKTVRVWDIKTGQQKFCLKRHLDAVKCVAFSPDSLWIASGGEDHHICLWDLQAGSGRAITDFPRHYSDVICVAFSPDGQWLVSGREDHTVILYDLKKRDEHFHFFGHSEAVVKVGFSSDSQSIYSISRDLTIRFWKTSLVKTYTTDKMTLQIKRALPTLSVAAISSDGQWVISGDKNGGMKFWDPQVGKQQGFLGSHRTGVSSITFSNDSKKVLTGGNDFFIRLWDCESKKLEFSFQGHQDNIKALAFSQDGKWAISGSGDKSVRLWDCETGQEKAFLNAHTDQVYSVAFSPDGKLALSGGGDAQVMLWNCETRNVVKYFREHHLAVKCVAFSPDGRFILSAGFDKKILIRDLQTGDLLHSLEGHQEAITTASFSTNGQWVISGSEDKTVRIWDCETGKQIYSFPSAYGIVQAVLVSNNKDLLIVNKQSAMQMWQLFDENNLWRPWLKWTSPSALSASHLNLEEVKGLSESNRSLLKQQGATEEREEKDRS